MFPSLVELHKPPNDCGVKTTVPSSSGRFSKGLDVGTHGLRQFDDGVRTCLLFGDPKR